MEHDGGCHCGNLHLRLRLTRPPADNATRSCACSFCRAHATRTVSDPEGEVEIWSRDWSRVERYRFASGTADYLLCKTCGVYIGAVCDTEHGTRAVINVNSLADRASFPPASSFPDHDGEPTGARIARRSANWTPAVVHEAASAE
jgi:hypothetical protein